MSDFKDGDRVRGASDWEVQTVTDYPVDLTHVLNNHYELVEVAHYAPPGVPMVAITPERIAWWDELACDLENLQDPQGFEYGTSQAAAKAIRAMLAEARGEVAHA